MTKAKIVLCLAILLLTGGAFAQDSRSGLVASISIEGTQDTEMATFGNSSQVAKFNESVKHNTLKRLVDLFKLDTIAFIPGMQIKYKQGLNRFVGVSKLDSEQKNAAKSFFYTFRIKCDIAFDQTLGGFIIDQTSSRANVYITIGVFNANGEKVATYKGKSKDSITFFGKNARRAQWLSAQDFESVYQSALESLEAK
jgi:hypothetical protein